MTRIIAIAASLALFFVLASPAAACDGSKSADTGTETSTDSSES